MAGRAFMLPGKYVIMETVIFWQYEIDYMMVKKYLDVNSTISTYILYLVKKFNH